MNYDELCKSIGIDRGAITKACADPPNTAIRKEPYYLKRKIGQRVNPPPGADLSHLVSKTARQIASKLRRK